MLSFYDVPRLLVGTLTTLEFGAVGTSLVIAVLFLIFGLFIDAIPVITILGTVLLPVAQAASIHPVAFAISRILSYIVTVQLRIRHVLSCSKSRLSLSTNNEPSNTRKAVKRICCHYSNCIIQTVA